MNRPARMSLLTKLRRLHEVLDRAVADRLESREEPPVRVDVEDPDTRPPSTGPRVFEMPPIGRDASEVPPPKDADAARRDVSKCPVCDRAVEELVTYRGGDLCAECRDLLTGRGARR